MGLFVRGQGRSDVWLLLDLSGVLSITATALLAVATWLLTVPLADRMRRAGNRGPFEVLVRRITYGPPPQRDRA